MHLLLNGPNQDTPTSKWVLWGHFTQSARSLQALKTREPGFHVTRHFSHQPSQKTWKPVRLPCTLCPDRAIKPAPVVGPTSGGVPDDLQGLRS